MCRCNVCFNEAVYVSNNSNLALCDDCYYSMSDDFESLMEDELGCSFEEYYEFEYIED